jgi:single-strand DNA-binding protein
LSREPELRSTASGSTILVFGLAVNERIKRGDEWTDYPNFFDCVMFGKRAESLSKIMTKGMKVALSGRLRYSSWENKDGQRRSKVEVIAEEVELMQRRSDGDDAGGHGSQSAETYSGGYENGHQNGPQTSTGQYDDMYDEDIPF